MKPELEPMNVTIKLPAEIGLIFRRALYITGRTRIEVISDAIRLAYADLQEPMYAAPHGNLVQPPDRDRRHPAPTGLRAPDDQDGPGSGSDPAGLPKPHRPKSKPTKPKAKQVKAKVRAPKAIPPPEARPPKPPRTTLATGKSILDDDTLPPFRPKPLTPLDELRADPYNFKGLDGDIWHHDHMGVPVEEIAAMYDMTVAEVIERLGIMNAPKPPPAYEHVWVDQMSPEETLKNQRWRKSG